MGRGQRLDYILAPPELLKPKKEKDVKVTEVLHQRELNLRRTREREDATEPGVYSVF